MQEGYGNAILTEYSIFGSSTGVSSPKQSRRFTNFHLQITVIWLTEKIALFYYWICVSIDMIPGFVPVFEQKIQGLFKDFQGHISHISRTLFNSKRALILRLFLVLPQHR